MARAGGMQTRWLFACLLISFCTIYALYYPATYGIEDECNILQLSYSLNHGTIFPDQAGPGAGLPVNGHNVSKFSVFHAALIAPAWKIDWRLSFLVTAAFFVTGAFVIRGWLLREKLNGDWSALYFLLPGALYYTQSVMAAVPAASAGLIGASLLMRESPRTLLAGLALGASVLLHPWMGPFVAMLSAVWILERPSVERMVNARWLLAGALGPIVMLAGYNFATTGSPFRSVYTMLDHQASFAGSRFVTFFPFYVASLAIFPLAGWAVFSPKWASGWAIPAGSATALLLASTYYYRDGLNVSSAHVGTLAALLAGAIPGQRFLIPVSMVACVPAARFLNSYFEVAPRWLVEYARPLALVTFILGFSALSAAHQSYLRAHAAVQTVLCQTIPANARVTISDEVLKHMAPNCKVFQRVESGRSDQIPPADSFTVWLGAPGMAPPQQWIAKRDSKSFQIRSWIWNRDLWISRPAEASAVSYGSPR